MKMAMARLFASVSGPRFFLCSSTASGGLASESRGTDSAEERSSGSSSDDDDASEGEHMGTPRQTPDPMAMLFGTSSAASGKPSKSVPARGKAAGKAAPAAHSSSSATGSNKVCP